MAIAIWRGADCQLVPYLPNPGLSKMKNKTKNRNTKSGASLSLGIVGVRPAVDDHDMRHHEYTPAPPSPETFPAQKSPKEKQPPRLTLSGHSLSCVFPLHFLAIETDGRDGVLGSARGKRQSRQLWWKHLPPLRHVVRHEREDGRVPHQQRGGRHHREQGRQLSL